MSMHGFIGWLRKQPQFDDLSNDAGKIRSFKKLVVEMDDCRAMKEAWWMLFDAIYQWPGELPPDWPRHVFEGRGGEPDPPDDMVDALIEYADPERAVTGGVPVMSEEEFTFTLYAIAQAQAHGADVAEEASRLNCTPMQKCIANRRLSL